MTMSYAHPKLIKSNSDNSDCSLGLWFSYDQKQWNFAAISSRHRVRPRRYCAAVASGSSAKQLHLLAPHRHTSRMMPHVTCLVNQMNQMNQMNQQTCGDLWRAVQWLAVASVSTCSGALKGNGGAAKAEGRAQAGGRCMGSQAGGRCMGSITSCRCHAAGPAGPSSTSIHSSNPVSIWNTLNTNPKRIQTRLQVPFERYKACGLTAELQTWWMHFCHFYKHLYTGN